MIGNAKVGISSMRKMDQGPVSRQEKENTSSLLNQTSDSIMMGSGGKANSKMGKNRMGFPGVQNSSYMSSTQKRRGL